MLKLLPVPCIMLFFAEAKTELLRSNHMPQRPRSYAADDIDFSPQVPTLLWWQSIRHLS